MDSKLSAEWCECQDKGEASYSRDIHKNDNPCSCGLSIPHYHCHQCGGITQTEEEEWPRPVGDGSTPSLGFNPKG